MDYSPAIIKKGNSISSMYEYKPRSYYIQTKGSERTDKLRYASKRLKLNQFGAAAQLHTAKSVTEKL